MAVTLSDDRRRSFTFMSAPKRIVSLVPSDSYTVWALGAGASLVGRTDYCVEPADIGSVPSVGGTKNPRLEEIFALEPDLVLVNQEENTRSDIEKMVARGLRVYVSFPQRVADGFAHMARLARILHVDRDPAVKERLREAYALLSMPSLELTVPRRAFCPIWMKPLMTINGATYISDTLAAAGLDNAFARRDRLYPLTADLGLGDPVPAADRDTRYPRVSVEELVEAAPDLVLLPTEPHPFTQEDEATMRAWFSQSSKMPIFVPIDGKDMCWHGAWAVHGLPRLRAAVRQLVLE